MIDPLLVKAVSIGFGLLLLGAAWHKAQAPAGFRAVLADYQLLPAGLLPLAAVAMPVVEAIIGVAWLAGIGTRLVALATAALLAGYALAMAINLFRGRVHIGCGCGLAGSSAEDQPLSWGLVVRNGVLVSIALLASAPAADRNLGLLDWLTVTAALIATTLLYVGATQLLTNDSAIRSWRNPRG